MFGNYLKLLLKLIILCQLKLWAACHRCNTALIPQIDFGNGDSILKQAHSCPSGTDQVRVSGLISIPGRPSLFGDHIYDIYPGVAVNVAPISWGRTELRFKRISTDIFKIRVTSFNTWVFFWYQFRGNQADLAYRATANFDSDASNNHQATLNPTFDNNDPAGGGYGVGDNWRDIWTVLGAFKGTVALTSYSCNSLERSYMTKTYLLMMLTAAADLKAFYLIDRDSQTFANLISATKKQPYLVRGKDKSVEAAFDPVKNGNKFEVRSGKQYTIGDVNLHFQTTERFRIVTIAMKVKIISLPPSGKEEPLVTLRSRKTFSLVVSSSGALTLKNGASNSFSTGLTITAGSFHYLKVAIARFDISNYDSAWSIALDTRDSEVGGTMTWNSLTDTTTRLQDVWSFVIGGSTVSGGTLNFEVSMVSVHKGAFLFRDATKLPCYNEMNNANNPCKFEVMTSTGQVCYDCDTSSGAKWVFNPAEKGLLCHSSASIPTGYKQRTGSFYHPSIYSTCDEGAYPSGSSCASCHTSCSVCSGPLASSCDECVWNNKEVAPSGGGTCADCAVTAGKWMLYGGCYNCSIAHCAVCTYDITCEQCLGTRVFTNNLCCDINKGQFVNTGNSPATCENCHSSCKRCEGSGSNKCLECYDGALYNPTAKTCTVCQANEVVVGNSCVVCDPSQKKWINTGNIPKTCDSCGTKCNACSSATSCTTCESGYIPAGDGTNNCVLCDPSQKKWVNTANSPHTCESCGTHCDACSSGTSCTTCASGYVPKNDGTNNCVLCDTSASKWVNTANNPHTCDPCGTNCKLCPNTNSCTTCKDSHVKISGSGNCAFCDLTNGKWIDTNKNPATCESCGDNCQVCPFSGSCTTCHHPYVPNPTSGGCDLCDLNNKKFINTLVSPPTCQNCGTNCKACSNGSSCDTCEDDHVPVGGGSGDCSFCDKNNGRWLNTASTPHSCNNCGTQCKVCSNGNSCDTCQPQHVVNPSTPKDCLLCDTSTPKFINTDNSPATCDSCDTGCQKCSSLSTCTTCKPSHVPISGTGKCQFCDVSNKKWIDTASSPHSCKSCPTGCIGCTSQTFCTGCESGYIEYNNLCYQCDFSQNKFLDFSGPTPVCRSCSSGCNGCSGQADNCSGCSSPKVLVTDPNTAKKSCQIPTPGTTPTTTTQTTTTTTTTNSGKDPRPKSPPPGPTLPNLGPNSPITGPSLTRDPNCEPLCFQCAGNGICSMCMPTRCITMEGECVSCLGAGIEFEPKGVFFEDAVLTWYAYQRKMNNITEYLVTFSEQEIILPRGATLINAQDYMDVEIKGYQSGVQFNHIVEYNFDIRRLTVKFEFIEQIERSPMTFSFRKKDQFQSITGKMLAHIDYTLDFPGHKVMPETLDKVIQGLTYVTKDGVRGIFGTTPPALIAGSLFSNSMSFLGKSTQIIEFTGLMELFNIEFDPNMGTFLGQINEATTVDFLNFYSNDRTDTVENSIAAQWKGKLSKKEIKPYLLQDIGYFGITLIIIYIITLIFILFGCRLPRFLTSLRISFFNILLIDYTCISLRTLGHFPTATEDPHSALDYVSFGGSCFLLTMFFGELCYMAVKSNDPYLYQQVEEAKGINNNKKNKNKNGHKFKTITKYKKLSKTDKFLQEVFYDGISREALKKSFFARNYNLFYLLRFVIVCSFIFNLQHLPAIQVTFSFFILVGFSVISLYQQFTIGLFDSKFLVVFKVIQEVSMSLIITLINLFAIDYYRDFLSQKAKIALVATFIGLLVINILLEILSALVSIFYFVKDLVQECAQRRKKRKTKMNKKQPSVNNLLDSPSPPARMSVFEPSMPATPVNVSSTGSTRLGKRKTQMRMSKFGGRARHMKKQRDKLKLAFKPTESGKFTQKLRKNEKPGHNRKTSFESFLLDSPNRVRSKLLSRKTKVGMKRSFKKRITKQQKKRVENLESPGKVIGLTAMTIQDSEKIDYPVEMPPVQETEHAPERESQLQKSPKNEKINLKEKKEEDIVFNSDFGWVFDDLEEL